MKRGAHVIGAVPAVMHRGIRARHVIIGQHVGKLESPGPLGAGARHAGVAA